MRKGVSILCSASYRGTHYSGVPDLTWLKELGAWGEERMNEDYCCLRSIGLQIPVLYY